MKVHTAQIRLETAGFCDIRDITGELLRIVAEAGVKTGVVCLGCPGSTTGITTIEFEPGAVADFQRALEQLAPQAGEYHHNDTWGDGNGFAHLRSALVGTSRCFPVREGRPELGTWQQVVFLDFDNRARRRSITVTVLGE
ncbi:MAG: secondary thiamine-phosphate synthase enzyme YjbQ [bacterium]